MSGTYLVDPRGWEYDIQSVYSAYMGYFQLHNILWYDQTWGQFFETFERFLTFSWPVVTVTDARTGRAHIVTRKSSIAAFLKMIKTRFGEMLPEVDNMLLIKPVETSQRHLRHVNDWPTYKKLYATLPAVTFAALKARVRMGDPVIIRELWAMRDKTFLVIDFECPEKKDRACVEWGYAVIRCSHLEAAGAWPPVPSENYRKGHYVISEYANASSGKTSPTVSWQYAFGDSEVISKAKLPRIVQSLLSSLLSPESDSVANDVVLVGHGVQAVLQHLDDMKIKLPTNVLILDVAYFERALFIAGERGAMVSRKTGATRLPESLLTLGGILHSLGIAPPPSCVLHNAGNDAFMALVALQRMADTKNGIDVVASETKETETDAKAGGTNGGGHVSRAATAAARFFRPLSGTIRRSEASVVNGHGPGNGKGAKDPSMQSRTGADEMGVMDVQMSEKRASMNEKRMSMNEKRASMMSMRTTATAMSAATVKTTKTTGTAKTTGTIKSNKSTTSTMKTNMNTIPRLHWALPKDEDLSNSGVGRHTSSGWWWTPTPMPTPPPTVPDRGQWRHSTFC